MFPGKFDIWFHSHTIWHIGVVAGAAILLNSFIQMSIAIGDKTCEELMFNNTWY
jgi:predicted membrane channel-forming protein YqfA (hemolysin III family)